MLITLDEAKAHLNVTTSDDDALITDMIADATDHVQAWVTVDLSTGDVPAGIKRAVKLVVAGYYDNREAEPSSDFLGPIGPYRKWVF